MKDKDSVMDALMPRSLIVAMLLILGCSPVDSADVAPNIQNAQAPSASSPTAEVEASSFAAEAIAEGPEVDQATRPVEAAVTIPPAARPAPPPSPSTPPAPPKPTAAQLARWAVAEYSPLVLLANREAGKSGLVTGMVHAPDGQSYVLAGTRVDLWSPANDAPIHTFAELFKQNQELHAKSLAVAPDGSWFAMGDSEGMLRIWSLRNRDELRSQKIYNNDITQIAVSPDGAELATISYDDEISTWDTATLAKKSVFKVDTNGLKEIEFVAPGKLAAAGETTSVWDTSDGKVLHVLSSGRYNFTLVQSPDGKRFVFGDQDRFKLWDVDSAKVAGELQGDFAGNEMAAFSPDGRYLATVNGSSLRVWENSTGQLRQIEDLFGRPVVGLGWLPGSQILLVVSEYGQTRFWGTAAAGEKLGMHSLHKTTALPEATSRVPATPAQMLAAIDLRTFPRLPGEPASVFMPTSLDYVSAVDEEEARLFYRHQLGEQGWTAEEPPAQPDAILFHKQGFALGVSFGKEEPERTSVHLHTDGNYDLRWAPRCDAGPIEVVYEGPQTVIYRVKADLVRIETRVLRQMFEAGWVPYARLNSSHSETPESRDQEFLWNGMSLRVSIGKFPDDKDSYTVQYSLFPQPNALPVPPDADFLEFAGYPEPYLVAHTAMGLDQARDFYDQALVAQGWLPLRHGRSLKEKYNWLAYMRGQRDLIVGLESLPDGRTRIRVGNGLENSSWQVAATIEPEESQDPKLEPSQPQAGIQAADFPRLSADQSATIDPRERSIEVRIEGSTLADVADRYSKELGGLGWTPTDQGIRGEDYTFLTFTKDGNDIALRARKMDGTAIVNFQGEGILWDKPLPGPKPVISFENWMRDNQLPATLKWLERYESEMRNR